MSTYLVTGAAGFIGSHIVEELIQRGDKVIALDDLSAGFSSNLPRGTIFQKGTILDSILIQKICADNDISGIFHLAAVASVKKSIENPKLVHEINTTGTLNILECARKFDIDKIVLSASAAAYGNNPSFPKTETMTPEPLSPYATSKIAAEHYLNNYNYLYDMHNTSLRYFNVFGPRQNPNGEYAAVISKFSERITKRMPITIYGDGEQTRDFVFIKDVVQANLRAMDSINPKSADLFNIGTGIQTSLNTLANQMMHIADIEVPIHYEPVRDGDVRYSCANISKAQAILNYHPEYSLEDGLKLTLATFQT